MLSLSRDPGDNDGGHDNSGENAGERLNKKRKSELAIQNVVVFVFKKHEHEPQWCIRQEVNVFPELLRDTSVELALHRQRNALLDVAAPKRQACTSLWWHTVLACQRP